MKKAVVLLPTYNERDTLAKFAVEVLAQENKAPGWKIEILIADSHSPDGTAEIAKQLAKKNPKIHTINVGKGLGVAFVEGQRYSLEHFHPDALVNLDSDGQVGADVLPKMLKALDEGYDLALGSRFVAGGENQLSPLRKLFTLGSCFICRLVMGPWDIGEFTNSARAFTPELFQKINFKKVPWREKTYIIQPSFLNEAVLSGAKYKEVPLVFKNRAEGYSKNKVFNYTYDIVTYVIDARLHKWGINTPFFYWSRRAKTFIKFGLVGFLGTIVDFVFYNIFIMLMHIAPATSKAFSTEIAIVNNFALNHFWTFKYRKTKSSLWAKFGTFNLVSLGGLAIGVLIIKFLHLLYGDGIASFLGLEIQYYNLYFFATIPPVMIWNFTVNHLITWKNQED